MIFTLLGTGTSQGIPVLGCPCKVCESTNSKDKRLRTSLLIQQDDFTLAIDSGPDFRQQLLRENVKNLDAILYTHSHQDHVAGLDDIRAFNFFQQKPMDVYATQEVQQNIRREFYYAFDEKNDYPWIPKVKFHSITLSPFQIGHLKIIPVEVMHHKLSVLGYRFGEFTYITDASKIAEKEIEKIKGSKILVLNALRKEKHISHFSLAEAIELSQKIGPEKTYFTHMSHQMGLHDEVSNELPDGIYLGYDGLKIEL